MKQVTKFESEDGNLFPDEESCLRWEQWCEAVKEANEMIANNATVASVLIRAWQPLGYDPMESLTAEERVMLERTHANKKLIISHWQGQDRPGYRLCWIGKDQSLFVHGDAGSWSGPYGSHMTIRDYVRYLSGTVTKETKDDE